MLVVLVLLMVYTFVSPEGRVFDAPEDDEGLRNFALEKKMIKQRVHLSNVKSLLDPTSGKKQLQGWQPLSKLRTRSAEHARLSV